MTPEEKFFPKVSKPDDPDGCWVWVGHRTHLGYGRLWLGPLHNDAVVFVHRWAYEHFVGPIPEGLSVLHRCDNPSCVNPAHLYAGTHADNMRDRLERGHYSNGEEHHASRLTTEQVLAIRRRYSGTRGELTAFAHEYGVGVAAIWSVVHRKTWLHLAADTP